MDTDIQREACKQGMRSNSSLSDREVGCISGKDEGDPIASDYWQKKAEALWSLLDDIDTYGDMYKPDQTPYFKAVNKKATERFYHLDSDGYKLIDKKAP